MNRETYAGAGWGRAGHFPGHTGPALQPDSRKVLELDASDIEVLREATSWGHRDFAFLTRLRDFLYGAQRVRIEVDPRGTTTLGNGFAAAFAPGPGLAHDDPDGAQA